jgi:hypothetical protein
VPALVSDTAVNREITERNVHFFKASDPQDLARLMIERISLGAEPPAPPAELLRRGQERRRACGDMLFAAIEHVRQTASTS